MRIYIHIHAHVHLRLYVCVHAYYVYSHARLYAYVVCVCAVCVCICVCHMHARIHAWVKNSVCARMHATMYSCFVPSFLSALCFLCLPQISHKSYLHRGQNLARSRWRASLPSPLDPELLLGSPCMQLQVKTRKAPRTMPPRFMTHGPRTKPDGNTRRQLSEGRRGAWGRGGSAACSSGSACC